MQCREIVNVSLFPDLKQPLLSGELFNWRCEKCGFETDIPYPSLYLDTDRRYIILFNPQRNDIFKIESILGIDKNIKESGRKTLSLSVEDTNRLMANIPQFIPQGDKLEMYRLRYVSDILTLREKVSIFEAALDDIAIERMKFFISLTPEAHFLRNDFYFHSVNYNDEEAIAEGHKRGMMRYISIKGSNADFFKFPMEVYYDYLLACTIDPRMHREGVCCIDREWMMRTLSAQ